MQLYRKFIREAEKVMRIMFIVYHDLKTEARSQEILECAQKIGQTILVSYSRPSNDAKFKFIVTGNGKRKYFQFIFTSIKSIVKENPDVIILHDNYTSIIIPFLLIFKKNTKLIYDSSELYIEKRLIKSVKLIGAAVLKLFEKKYMKFADIVIAANVERAEIMKSYFGLSELPVIFDNIHKIEDDYNLELCEEKFGNLFLEDKFNIIYAGGVSRQRLTFELAEAVGTLGNEYSLVVVGSASRIDREEFSRMLCKSGIKNVTYIGFIQRDELRYMLKKASISVSIFAQDTFNNVYCASGKLFESLFEGTPVLTSENPPLKRVCNDYGIGISTNDFKQGIIHLRSNYDYYHQNVKYYIGTIDVKERIEKLARTLKCKL